MTGWFLASLHHVVFLGLIVMLAMQRALLKTDPLPIPRIAKLDIGYGATAGLMVLVGVARVIWGEKGWAYYADNHLFWGKMGLFALIAIASIRPTLIYLKWRKAQREDGAFVPETKDVRAARILVGNQMILLVFVVILAAGMARWPL